MALSFICLFRYILEDGATLEINRGSDFDFKQAAASDCFRFRTRHLPNIQTATHLTVLIGDRFVSIQTGEGDSYSYCSDCLFSLSETGDSLLIHLNGDIDNRELDGICSASLSWECETFDGEFNYCYLHIR